MVCYIEPSQKPPLETVWKTVMYFQRIPGRWLDEPLLNQSLTEASHRRANTSFPWRKAFSAVLCSSFNEEILSSSHVTDAVAVNLLRSHCCFEQTASQCRITHTSTTPGAHRTQHPRHSPFGLWTASSDFGHHHLGFVEPDVTLCGRPFGAELVLS